MRADQWKSVHVILHGIDGHLPSLDRVAILTIRAELPPMKIGMAVRALVSDVGKYLFGVARSAGNARVHSAQRIARLMIMIEFRTGADGTPTGGGVTTHAGNFQWPVRILHRGVRLRAHHSGEHKESRCY